MIDFKETKFVETKKVWRLTDADIRQAIVDFMLAKTGAEIKASDIDHDFPEEVFIIQVRNKSETTVPWKFPESGDNL